MGKNHTPSQNLPATKSETVGKNAPDCKRGSKPQELSEEERESQSEKIFGNSGK
jgi:hypothetical protein